VNEKKGIIVLLVLAVLVIGFIAVTLPESNTGQAISQKISQGSVDKTRAVGTGTINFKPAGGN